MNQLLYITILAPLLSLLISFFCKNYQEKAIFFTSIAAIGINFIVFLLAFIGFAQSGFEPIFLPGVPVYHSPEAEININFFLDGYSFTYLFVATILAGTITFFSKFYMHREPGYRRFFNNLIFFYLGLVVILMSGNLETLFVGWEIIGVTSFFLIGFYRERYLPIKNALKVVSLYRVADIALLLSIWVCHHYFLHSIQFNNFLDLTTVLPHIERAWLYQFLIPSLFLLAATVKSAQFPFSSWLPRAMEGPTTSSAIFYGSLSVHIGVFLLIRTSPLWEHIIPFKITLVAIGLITSLVSTFIARVQSSIKTQIAYSSIAQIGLMFIEVALGWYWLAMVHFASHAFLRSYQLLVSPSVLSYRIHDQFFNFIKPAEQGYKTLWDKLRLSIYVLGIREFHLDQWMYKYLWSPFKKLGNLLQRIPPVLIFAIYIPVFLASLYGVYHQSMLPTSLIERLPLIFGILSFFLILISFAERKSAMYSWVLIILNQLYITLSIGYNEVFDYSQVHLYLSGVFVCGLLGFLVIRILKNQGESVDLNSFHGHVYEHPSLAFLFVLSCLGLAGFPITPSFLGEDLMLTHVHAHQLDLILVIALNLILVGLVSFRIYARLFLGLHERGYHVVAYRSA